MKYTAFARSWFLNPDKPALEGYPSLYEGEDKLQKLNAEMANGRLAMLGIAGAMFAEGQTGETLAQQFENLSFSIV